MPRAKHPIVNVLQFFETQSLEVCDVAMAQIKAVLKRRKSLPPDQPQQPPMDWEKLGTTDPA